jgi:DNA adenine methylase
MKTPLRYAGGKSKAYKFITPHIKTESLVSPFLGGGSMESKWSSELDIKVIGHDIFYPLINFWSNLLERPELLADKMSLCHLLKRYTHKSRNFYCVGITLKTC